MNAERLKRRVRSANRKLAKFGVRISKFDPTTGKVVVRKKNSTVYLYCTNSPERAVELEKQKAEDWMKKEKEFCEYKASLGWWD